MITAIHSATVEAARQQMIEDSWELDIPERFAGLTLLSRAEAIYHTRKMGPEEKADFLWLAVPILRVHRGCDSGSFLAHSLTQTGVTHNLTFTQEGSSYDPISFDCEVLGQWSCDCVSTKDCYHLFLARIEQGRWEHPPSESEPPFALSSRHFVRRGDHIFRRLAEPGAVERMI